MSFSDNLKQSRNEKHLTQERLAELLDVSRQAVSKWEQGVGYPETDKLIVLAKVLRVSLDWLFKEELVDEEKSGIQTPIPSGVVAGLEAFSSAISGLMEQCIPETNNKD